MHFFFLNYHDLQDILIIYTFGTLKSKRNENNIIKN